MTSQPPEQIDWYGIPEEIDGSITEALTLERRVRERVVYQLQLRFV